MRAASIRAKLVAIVMITTAAALVISGLFTFLFAVASYRRDLARELQTLAQVIAVNSTAALEFSDVKTADENLRSAASLPEILSACLYDRLGRLFAQYQRPGAPAPCPAAPAGLGVQLAAEGFTVHEPVLMEAERIGTLRLFSQLAELRRRIRVELFTSLAVLLASALAALALSARLQRVVSSPILELAATAKSISQNRNFSLRAIKRTDDEIGAAVQAFNQMLDHIDETHLALRRAGESSRNQAHILQSILDTIGEGIAVCDARGQFLIWNPAAGRLLGGGPVTDGPSSWPERFGLLRPDGTLMAPDDLPLVRAMKGEAVTDLEMRLRVPAGEPTRWISATARALRDDRGELDGGVVVFRDVTERRAAEEALRALNATLEARIAERTARLEAQTAELTRSNRELEEFAYVASHDLQEPLRAMSSYTQLLRRLLAGQLTTDGELYLQQIQEGAARLRALINALLDYSGVGRRPLAVRETDLGAVVDTALEDLAPLIADSGATVTRGPLPTLMADPVQMAQLFRNLITNAIKFRGEAPPRVQVEAQRVDDSWQLTVRDNGIGIEPKYFERIFVIFQRLHGRERAGTGIGLAVCKKIVDRHGGEIRVESEPGKGAAFHIVLPATRA